MTPADVVTGNIYDKYGTRNPVARRLMAGFEAALDDLFALRRAGVAARRRLRRGRAHRALGAAARTRSGRWSGIDLDDPGLRASGSGAPGPGLTFQHRERDARSTSRTARSTPSRRSRSSSTSTIPAAALAELARVARRHLLLSVPREPVWRADQSRARRLSARPRQHAGARQPLVSARRSFDSRAASGRWSRADPRFPGRWSWFRAENRWGAAPMIGMTGGADG